MRATLCCLLIVLAMPVSVDAASPVEKIKREVAKEPTYNAKERLYALAAFGPEAKTTVWLVLDKSKADGDRYDVLFADLNGNGDLTEPSERIAASESDQGDAGDSKFKLPDLKDAMTGQTHSEFAISVSGGVKPKHMISLRWQGKREVGGGYPVDPENGYMRFATNAREAPIVWFNGDGPVQFQRWLDGGLKIGGQSDLSLFLGFTGVGSNTFCAFQQYVLPEGEGVRATLHYVDKEGNKRSAISELTDRC